MRRQPSMRRQPLKVSLWQRRVHPYNARSTASRLPTRSCKSKRLQFLQSQGTVRLLPRDATVLLFSNMHSHEKPYLGPLPRQFESPRALSTSTAMAAFHARANLLQTKKWRGIHQGYCRNPPSVFGQRVEGGFSRGPQYST